MSTFSFWRGNHEVDPETGMVKIPEGYYWHVGHRDIEGHIKMSLRKRLKGPFYSQIDYTFITEHATEVVLCDASQYLFGRAKKLGKFSAIKKVKRNQSNQFAGNYPPKKLGGAQ